MKKIRSLVMPMLAMPFLIGCGCNRNTTQYKVEASVFYNNGGTHEKAGTATVKGTPKAGENISVKLSTSGKKYALPKPVNQQLPDAIKLTSDAGSIDYNKVTYTFNSDANADLSFVMPAGNVTLNVEVTLKQKYDISSTIIGATSTIKVEGTEAYTAYAGDSIEITAVIDPYHEIPDGPEKACQLITSDDVTLTMNNFKIDMSQRAVIVSFTMPNNAVSVTGELEFLNYNVSCSITGATSTIKVNDEPSTTAHAGDNVEITASVETGYILPTTKEAAHALITSTDVSLADDNFEIKTSERQIIISFIMPDNVVSVTGALNMTDYNLSCTVTGASETAILVGGEPSTTAHYGDFVEVGIIVDDDYKMPTTQQEVLGKITSEDITLTTQNIELMPAYSLIVISFNMPDNAVALTGELDENPSYNISCNVTGASATGIMVNGEEANEAREGDSVEVGIRVGDAYAVPSTKEEILEKVNSTDITLTTDNVDFITGDRGVVISFTMPSNAVAITGAFDPLTFQANALANTSKTYLYHGSVAVTGGTEFIAGADVTCTITPDTDFNYPDSVEDIKFFSDPEGTTPLATTPQVTYTSGSETFTFKMPASAVYVAAVCDTTRPQVIVTTNVTYETANVFTKTSMGLTVNLEFSNVAEGYRLPDTLEEFLSCHTIDGNVGTGSLSWSKSGNKGTLQIAGVLDNLVITGAPIPVE